ncbi:MAG: hypothetical protein Ta2G_21520 [Termitinemataceae bacterium]|nr:MAG: hypothetical protein Ta2G_21520 [Termitinemataceae bacterium]
MNRDYLAHKLSTYKDQAEVVIDGKTVILKKGKKSIDWYPSFKLIDKIKQADGRYKNVYEKAP